MPTEEARLPQQQSISLPQLKPGVPVHHNGKDGIGDAIMLSWVWHTLNKAGKPCYFVSPQRQEIFRLFDVPAEYILTTTPTGMTYETTRIGDRVVAKMPDCGQIGGKDWMRSWLDHYGAEGLEPVRPTYTLPDDYPSWAEEKWEEWSRRWYTGGPRVLIFPYAAWGQRNWPYPYWHRLAQYLHHAGYQVITMEPSWDPKHKWPYMLGGLSTYHMAAMCASADLVLGNDSGPAHMASTMGTDVLAMVGPSRPDLYFTHTPEVETMAVSASEVSCVGCNFTTTRGWQDWCYKGCEALMRLTPERVFERVKQKLPRSPHVTVPITPMQGYANELMNNAHKPEQRGHLFQSRNGTVTETDYLRCIYGLIVATKPYTVLETGTHEADGTLIIARALRDNTVGHLWTVESDEKLADLAKTIVKERGFSDIVTPLHTKSDDFIKAAGGPAATKFEFVFLDSGLWFRPTELRLLLEHNLLAPGAIVCMHDTQKAGYLTGPYTECEKMWEELSPIIRKWKLRHINLPMSRGMTILQLPKGDNPED